MGEKHTIAILVYNNHQITFQMIRQLRNSGCKEHILIYDNGSKPSYEHKIEDNNFSYHRNEENIYVNPAWNDIFDLIQTKYLTLLNNDCFIESNGYFNDIINHMEKNDIILSTCKTKNIPKYNLLIKYFYKLLFFSYRNKPLLFTDNARRQGWLMTLNLDIYKSLDYKIPNYLKLWYGDDWIWSQIMKNKLRYAIYTNRYALHIRSASSSKFMNIIEEDIINIEKEGKWFSEVTKEMHSKKYV